MGIRFSKAEPLKPTATAITHYVKTRMASGELNNLAVYLPALNDKTFQTLKKRFSKVTRQPFGYVKFEV